LYCTLKGQKKNDAGKRLTKASSRLPFTRFSLKIKKNKSVFPCSSILGFLTQFHEIGFISSNNVYTQNKEISYLSFSSLLNVFKKVVYHTRRFFEMVNVKVVENGVQAKDTIEQFLREGFTKDEVYLLAHHQDRSEDLTAATNTNNIGLSEQGVFDAIANVFRSRGDELRAKMRSLGLSQPEAERYEEELDHGKVIVVASKVA
jgi:Heat induced stress protein YflT